MVTKKQPELNFNNLFQELARDVRELIQPGGSEYDILEFIEKEVNLGISLTTQQNLCLKLLYNLLLNEEEISILEFWKNQDRTTWNETDVYQTLILESGRRSGKSTLVALVCAYEFYQLCRMNSPQRYYNIATSTPITILVLATTADQAKRTIFKQVVGIVNNSPYFKSLKDKGLLFVGKEEITYEEKLLYIYSGNSKSGAQVGGTIKCLAMDEVARFQDTDGHSNALELWSNLGISCAPFKQHAIRIAISSAWYKGDAIEQLYEATREDDTAIGLRLCSWDMNPVHAARDNPVVASEYARDPKQAAIEFEGIRPGDMDSYLNEEEVKAAFKGKSAISVEVYETNTKPALVQVNVTRIDNCVYPTVAHIDPAIVNDSYALAYGHSEFNRDKHIVVIDGVVMWEPTHSAQVSMANVLDTLFIVGKSVNLIKVTADHYSSAETVQRLRLAGYAAETIHFSNKIQLEMYRLANDLLHEDRLILPATFKWKPKVIRELLQVRLIHGSKIDHPKGGSKDAADAIVAVVYQLVRRSVSDQPAVGTISTALPAIKDNNFQAVQRQSFSDKRSQALNALARRALFRSGS